MNDNHSQHSRQTIGIDAFVAGLRGIPGFHSEAVWQHLQTFGVDCDSLAPYVFFDRACYTRNLIFKNDDFELLTVCWETGQASRIHNHRDQRCWMLLPQGRLLCQNYAVHDRDPAERTCRLEATDKFEMTSASPAEVEADQPVHQVLNLTDFGERAVSLHIYAKPFDTCEVYQPDKGTYGDVQLWYTSKRGELCDGQTAERP